MASKQKSSDFEDRFFDLLKGTIDGIDNRVDHLTDNVEVNTKRIAKLENAVFPDKPLTSSQLPPWYRDASVIKLLTLVAGAVILAISLVAALSGKQLPGIF